MCEDHQAIFEWQRENIAPGSIIRSVAYQVPEGWYIKTVFKRQEDAMAYHRYVHPNEPDHFVPVFRDPRAE